MARWLDRLQLPPIKRPPSNLDQPLPSVAAATVQTDPNPWVESSKLLLAGGVAGAVSKTATAPLARLTILLQVRRPKPCKSFSGLYGHNAVLSRSKVLSVLSWLAHMSAAVLLVAIATEVRLRTADQSPAADHVVPQHGNSKATQFRCLIL